MIIAEFTESCKSKYNILYSCCKHSSEIPCSETNDEHQKKKVDKTPSTPNLFQKDKKKNATSSDKVIFN